MSIITLIEINIARSDPFEWNEKGVLKQEVGMTPDNEKDSKVEIDKVST